MDTNESPIETLEDIFSQVAAAPPGSREPLLQELCSDDVVRERVRELLGADSSVDAVVDRVLYPAEASFHPGHSIGSYKLLEEIGQGGMGIVYMAEQVEPVRRKVALKVIKPGVDTRQVIARFEAERQALSMMDHPNIASVLEAGTTKTGLPYFVMELVKGRPITDYCESHQVPPHQRLELFISVCMAIQHAHQKGVIHRDIKPSNVLVAEYDGEPVAKVIDFGVAKAIGQPLTERTLFTNFGQIVGTFEYMSPEQSRFNQLDVDTRSDIYSLGILLYELLTGSTPFEKESLRGAAWEEMLRIIREEEPPKPSTRLSTNQDSRATTREDRKQAQNLSRLVRGELDWIVMKAIEKERNRRYETPSAFAKDVMNFLRGDAVAACPPSLPYRFQKFARRNKATLVTSALVVSSLLAGLVTTGWQAYRATQAEAVAIKNAALAEGAEKEAQEEAAVAKALADFMKNDLLGLEGGLAVIRDGEEPNPDLKLVTLLDRAWEKMDDRLLDQPVERRRVLMLLVYAYSSVGRYETAAEVMEQAFAEASPRIDDALMLNGFYNPLSLLYLKSERWEDATELLEQIVAHLKKTEGPSASYTTETMSNLAFAYLQQDRIKEAEATLNQCVKVNPDQFSLTNLGELKEKIGLDSEAEQLFIRAWQHCQNFSNPTRNEIAMTVMAIHRLALFYEQRALHDQAAPVLCELVNLISSSQGDQHLQTMYAKERLATTYIAFDRADDAESLLRACLQIRLNSKPDHWRTFNGKSLLGWALLRQGDLESAEKLLVEGYEGLVERREKMAEPDRTELISNAKQRLVQLRAEQKRTTSQPSTSTSE